MTWWQQAIILLSGFISVILWIHAYRQIKEKKKAFTTTPFLLFLGVFVWGDVLILGPFWIGVSLLTFFLNDWYLFVLIVSVFWVVRSLGEVIYWLNEQFAGEHRNPPHTLRLHTIFQNDAVWFIYQLFWQCVLVLAIIASIYTARLWLFT